MAYNFKTLAVLPKNERGIYGKTQVQNQIIYVNPNLKDTLKYSLDNAAANDTILLIGAQGMDPAENILEQIL